MKSHPTLMCGLFKQVGVTWATGEICWHPQHTIDHNTIQRYKSSEGGKPDPSGVGYSIIYNQQTLVPPYPPVYHTIANDIAQLQHKSRS